MITLIWAKTVCAVSEVNDEKWMVKLIGLLWFQRQNFAKAWIEKGCFIWSHKKCPKEMCEYLEMSQSDV